jgi:acyl dehydratase
MADSVPKACCHGTLPILVRGADVAGSAVGCAVVAKSGRGPAGTRRHPGPVDEPVVSRAGATDMFPTDVAVACALRGESMKVFAGLDELVAAQGSQLGPTEWLEISQDRVNLFADATDDHQWIHVDPARAAEGPFGGTIAHGLLTLSLLPHFTHQLYRVDNVAMAINYGYNKVRFITPVKVGARLRARADISDVKQLDGAVQATMTVTVEVEGSEKPAAVAESIVRFLG